MRSCPFHCPGPFFPCQLRNGLDCFSLRTRSLRSLMYWPTGWSRVGFHELTCFFSPVFGEFGSDTRKNIAFFFNPGEAGGKHRCLEHPTFFEVGHILLQTGKGKPNFIHNGWLAIASNNRIDNTQHTFRFISALAEDNTIPPRPCRLCKANSLAH